ncbi:unnamed protein product [Acanthoscelides obtectus]|uniref:Uncharacterized protein n=1 Tax=Acanthoscelides obtectus TaxID=200917 RepID=A0A9P0Q0L2_ACAOB|nr:unnamed protein product [Acanthoscelides obtectus]CAK1674647.1 hypothetical protein AOBTE_LOCUS29692 [Acanthoscelides obtectus]
MVLEEIRNSLLRFLKKKMTKLERKIQEISSSSSCGEGYQTGAHRKMEVPTKLQGSAVQQEEPTISKVTAQEGEGILPALREKKLRN